MNLARPTRRQFLAASAASAAHWPCRPCAAGDIGGGKPITLVVSYPAGGGADAMARLIAPKLAEALGQPVIVDNKPGGSGTIAAGQVARAAPDGTTLLLDASSFAVNPALFQKLPYDNEKSFVPIAVLAQFPNVLVCTPSFEAQERRRRAAAGPRQAEGHRLCVVGQRLGAAPGRRAVRAARQGRADARAVSRRRAGAERRDGRPGAAVLRQRGLGARADPGGPPAPAGGDGGRRAAVRCPRCRRWPKPACRGTRCSSGIRSSRRPACTPPCATSSPPPWRARWRDAEVLGRVRALGGDVFTGDPAQFLKAQQALWARVVKERGITRE